ncbi:MAG: amino acid adenylation domain-containing protein [Actinomycetota bacterium]|nr:amino acid adenylation domain-containing protein [Actinomycetota bacterium]
MEAVGTTVADLVEAATAADPHGVAVTAGGASLTYAELDARANRLAHHLQSSGVGPDVPVGVCLNRSLDLAVALLAVLKAGGACLPLDPAYPAARLAFMAADAGVAAVVTRADLADRIPGAAAPLLRMDTDAATWADRPASPPVRSAGPDHLGYLIYTSGSTGRPKGVMLMHRGLINHHLAVVDLYRLAPGDRVLQFCSIGFDASIEEMFPTWAAGATVVYRPEDAPLLGRGWSEWLDGQGITVVNLPTAYWAAWARDLDASGATVPDGIRLVVVGGEKARGPVYRTWARLGGGRARWINAYGPTETTCMSTWYEAPSPAVDGAGSAAAVSGADPGGDRDPPVGRPLPGTTVLVVDEALRPVATGVRGELLIGGAGLARGYLNLPEQTAERFVLVGGARMYRTGDLVRRLPEGDLDYIGRVDDQVKIRGFRIETGEVEAALARHPHVAVAAVVAREDPPGDRQLAAYVVAATPDPPTTADLRRFLADHLPDHMVPASFTVLDELPLTPNGKVDRAALPAPTRPTAAARFSRSPGEDRMAAIWAAVLDMDSADIGPQSDFFELGGHSLLATQVIARVRDGFGTATPLRAIFQAPTLAGLTAVAEGGAEPGAGSVATPLTAVARGPGTRIPLSLAQEQMWALEAVASPPGLYNLTALHDLDGPVDRDVLGDALRHVVDRHEILRTGFRSEGGTPHQFVDPARDLDVPVTPSMPGDGAELQRLIAEQDAGPFDLTRPPLVRIGLFHLDRGATRLAVTFDHLICDGTGAAIFVTELLAAYAAITARRAPSLPPLDIQFADFAVWQRAHVTQAVLDHQLGWWRGILEGMPLGPAVPFDRVPAEPTRRIASSAFTVPAGTRVLLDEVARATASTVFTVAAAATAALLGRAGGTADVVMSTTLSGRTRSELENLVGMFSGIGRLRADLSGDPDFRTIVTRVRDRVLGMFENQDIPFMRVRRALLPDFPAPGSALVAALPTDFQYFHTGDLATQRIHFRGQLHPLGITLIDDGTEITGELSYKLDYYDPATVARLAGDLQRLLDAVAVDPGLRLSELPVTPPPRR